MTGWRLSLARLLALLADRLGWWARRLGNEAAPVPSSPVMAPGAPIAPPEHWLRRAEAAGVSAAGVPTRTKTQGRNEEGVSLATSSAPAWVPRADRPSGRGLGVLRARGGTEDTETARRELFETPGGLGPSPTARFTPPRRAFGFSQTAFEQTARLPEQADLWPTLPVRRVEEAPDVLVSAARLSRLEEEQQER